MAYYSQSAPFAAGHGQQQSTSPQNLQFFQSQYSAVSGHTTPAQTYGRAGGSDYMSSGGLHAMSDTAYGASGFEGGAAGVSGRMGEQGGLRTGWLAAFGTEGYDGEPPLLEELGINFGHIRTKTLTVLNPFARIDQHLMDDSDLYGALLYIILYGTNLLLAGKVFYGYIYGVAVFGTVALHVILSLMSPSLDTAGVMAGTSMAQPVSVPGSHGHDDPTMAGHFSATLTFTRSASVLGYCFLPLVMTSLLGIVVPMDTAFGYLLTMAAVGWCTYSSSGMFCAVARMHGMRFLVAYPLALFYVVFGIMGIFSSKGSGAAQAPIGTS